MELLAIIQALVGLILFGLAGFFSAKAVLGERDTVETACFAVLFALLFPPLLMFAANVWLGVRLNLFVAHGAYALVAGWGYLASRKRSMSPPISSAA